MVAHMLAEAPQVKYHIYVIGKVHDPLFQMYRVAAESLAQDRVDVLATVEGYFEAQYEQRLQQVVAEYGGAFAQAKPSAPLVYAEADDDKVLFFANDRRFLDWAFKRFNYEDNTRIIFYKRVASKAHKAQQATSGRSYCALGFQLGDDPQETVHFELFDEECPTIARNFMDLLAKPNFNGHLVHRVKAGAWIQAGDLVNGSGLHSESAEGGLLRHESFNVKHDRAGLIGMANQGHDTNGSQFYITMKGLPFLDGRSVIFGRVVSGMRAINRISKGETRNERPVKDVKVFGIPEHSVRGSVQEKIDQRDEQSAVKIQAVMRGKHSRKTANVTNRTKDDLAR